MKEQLVIILIRESDRRKAGIEKEGALNELDEWQACSLMSNTSICGVELFISGLLKKSFTLAEWKRQRGAQDGAREENQSH